VSDATTPPRRIAARPLDATAFAPFGQVIAVPAGGGREVNLGTALRFDHVAALENARAGARANLAVFRCAPQAPPVVLAMLERHPFSTQAFVAIHAGRWLICVAPERPDGEPDIAGLRAFVAGPGQGINLRRGTWHHPVLALDAPAQLLMLAWEDGSAGDGEARALDTPIEVTLER
jgi:ureidoglycolate lyase